MKTPDTSFTISNRTVFRILTMILAFGVMVFLVVSLRQQIVWLIIAFFFALALEPPVNALSKRMPKQSRGLAVLLVITTAVVVLSVIVAVLGPPIVRQFQSLIKELPGYYNTFLQSNNSISHYLADHNLVSLAQQNQDKLVGLFSSAGSGVVNFFVSIFGSIFAFFTILVLTFFMVLEWPRWHEVFWRYQDAKKVEHRKHLYDRMRKTVSGYINGNLFTSVIAAVTTIVFLTIMRIPNAAALGLLVGILDLIPMIGASLAAVIVSLFVLLVAGPVPALITLVFFIVYQQIENNILQPMVFSKTVNISPLVAGAAALFGAVLGGLIGALVAIPLAASVQILAKDYLDRRYPRVAQKHLKKNLVKKSSRPRATK